MVMATRKMIMITMLKTLMMKVMMGGQRDAADLPLTCYSSVVCFGMRVQSCLRSVYGMGKSQQEISSLNSSLKNKRENADW